MRPYGWQFSGDWQCDRQSGYCDIGWKDSGAKHKTISLWIPVVIFSTNGGFSCDYNCDVQVNTDNNSKGATEDLLEEVKHFPYQYIHIQRV